MDSKVDLGHWHLFLNRTNGIVRLLLAADVVRRGRRWRVLLHDGTKIKHAAREFNERIGWDKARSIRMTRAKSTASLL